MILPLLRKLRTTRRSPVSTITADLQPSAGRRWPGSPTPVRQLLIAATLGTCWFSAAGNQAAAQNNYLPSPPPAQVDSPLAGTAADQAREQYRQRLQAQMLRAQMEQGADPDFAEKAVAAQMAYLDASAAKSQRRTAMQTAVIPNSAPPVHIAPSPGARLQHRPRPQQQATFASARPPQFDQGQAANQGLSLNGPETAPARDFNIDQYEDRAVALQDRLSSLASRIKQGPTSAAHAEQAKQSRQFAQTPPAQGIRPTYRIAQSSNDSESAPALAAPEKSRPALPLQSDSMQHGNVQHTTATVSPASLTQPVAQAEAPTMQDFGSANDFRPTASSHPGQAPRLNSPQFSSPVSASSVPRQQPISVLEGGSIEQPLQQQPIAAQPISNFRFQEDAASLPTTPSRNPENDLRQQDDGSDLSRRLRQIEQGNGEQDRDRRFQQDDDDRPEAARTCDDYRRELLGESIRDIALDISPSPGRSREQFTAISRSWTDRLGNVVATGTMVDLRRGYVIVDSTNGRIKIPYGKLSDADWAAVAEYWQIPALCSVGSITPPSRYWAPQTFTWTASALCHKPLYFENRQLERYGHSHGPVLQPVQSTAHFFVSLFTLPYQTSIHPPTECMYALGYYRPGNCAPWLKDPVPISLDGMRRQALFTTGFAFIP